MPTDSVLKVTATSAGEALEWDSRKHNARHPMASQGCLKTAAPSLYHEVDRQNLLAEGGRKLSAAAESCPAPRRENFHGHQSLTESGQFTVPQLQPQKYFCQARNLLSTGHDLKNKLVSLDLGYDRDQPDNIFTLFMNKSKLGLSLSKFPQIPSQNPKFLITRNIHPHSRGQSRTNTPATEVNFSSR